MLSLTQRLWIAAEAPAEPLPGPPLETNKPCVICGASCGLALDVKHGLAKTDTDYMYYRASGSDVVCVRHVSGVRAEESTVRTLRCRKFGHNSKKTSAPLAWWDSRDVFAYMHREKLPVNATYAMTSGGIIPRDRLRVDAFGGAKGSGTGIGRGRWEGVYFPDVMERIYQETL